MQAARWISEPRLGVYLDAAGGEFDLAMEIYDWNLRLSSASFETIADFEVLLRNSVDRIVEARVPGTGLGWLENDSLLSEQSREQVEIARGRIASAGKTVHQSRIVAALSFGFWNALFYRSYEPLWVAHLHSVFPLGDGTRSQVARELSPLNRFRNRIAHHEPIFGHDLLVETGRCLTIAGWIDEDARDWIADRSCVATLLERDPRLNR